MINTDEKASPWSALRYKTFRWLWIASIASNIGTWMHEVGAGWLMTTLSTSPMQIALVQVAGSAPMFLLALPAGAIADIVDKKRYLLIIQIGMAAVAMLLAMLTLGGMMTASLLLLLTFGMGIGTALMMPAWSAMTPELVEKQDLSSAIAMSSLGINVARAIGPAIAGILISISGPWATFAVNAASFFAVMAVLFVWKRECKSSLLPGERLLGAIRAGWRYSRSSRPLQAVLIRSAAFFIGASAGMSLLPLIVRVELNGSASDYGLLLGGVGIGAVLGAMFLPRIRDRINPDLLVAGASLLYALVLAGLAMLRDLYWLIPVMVISGAAWIAVLSSLQMATQTSVPNWVRARALSVSILVFFGSMAAGGALWGYVASQWSTSSTLLIASGVVTAGIILTISFKLPVTEVEDLAPSLHWPTPVLTKDYDQERGPVLVTLEYQIDKEQEELFRIAMAEVRSMRMRNGAFSWGLVQDSECPQRWLEFFFDESWIEHLRHHDRVTRAEQRIEAVARRFQAAGINVHIRHFLAPAEIHNSKLSNTKPHE
ncbi:MFS transporter [Pseudomonas moraviensis]|uniref:MFS transporter n=1 Tax=Pseudomonas moraviensis TaxID=321662 RepID=UPI00135E4780|nr:MFS transporter [Pseudomonas moraviensis]MXI47081.1 MFS transporter [Pseudomonas moraviensis]